MFSFKPTLLMFVWFR